MNLCGQSLFFLILKIKDSFLGKKAKMYQIVASLFMQEYCNSYTEEVRMKLLSMELFTVFENIEN